MTLSLLKYSILSSLVIIAMLPMAGCSDSDATEITETGMVTLTFLVNPESSSTGTNPDGHPEEDGFGGEITIYNGDWLHAYIHDATSGKLLVHFRQSNGSPMNPMIISKNDDGSYFVKLSASNLIPGKSYRLSVMANCLDSSGDLYNLTPQFTNIPDNPTFLQNPHWMPFTGFRKFTFPEGLQSGETHDIGQIGLLRAATRIDINLNDEMKGKWIIQSAVIEGAGKKLYSHSYASPSETSVSAVDATEDLTITQMFNPCRLTLMDEPTGEDIPLRDVNADGSSFRIYLPEQENPIPASNEEIRIRLVMYQSVSDTKVSPVLYLRDDSGNPVNLVRNHIYRFNIKSIKPLFDVDVKVIDPENRIINVPAFN
ncbi:MAG: hypothetical protein K2M07_02820 [Muribaculaceae bacterium]|nr:hypothetical protein [Muribaculaceae bacterium]